MSIDPLMGPLPGAGGEATAGAGGAEEAGAGLGAGSALGLGAGPGGPGGPVRPGGRPGGAEEAALARDAETFRALLEAAENGAASVHGPGQEGVRVTGREDVREPGTDSGPDPGPEPGRENRVPRSGEEGDSFSAVSALVSEAMASWRAAREGGMSASWAAGAGGAAPLSEGAGAARMEGTIRTIAGIERLVESLAVSLPSDTRPVVVMRLAVDVLGGAEVRLEIAGETLHVVFRGAKPGGNPLEGLDVEALGDKLVDCAGGRAVEVAVDLGNAGGVESWRFSRETTSRPRRGKKDSDH